MNKIALTKMLVTTIVGAGTTKIVGSIIQNNVDPAVKLIDKVTIPVASIALGGMLADASSKYTDTKIDAIVAWYNETFKKTPVSE